MKLSHKNVATWDAIRQIMHGRTDPITNRQIADILDCDYQDVSHLTRIMVGAGELSKCHRAKPVPGSAALYLPRQNPSVSVGLKPERSLKEIANATLERRKKAKQELGRDEERKEQIQSLISMLQNWLDGTGCSLSHVSVVCTGCSSCTDECDHGSFYDDSDVMSMYKHIGALMLEIDEAKRAIYRQGCLD